MLGFCPCYSKFMISYPNMYQDPNLISSPFKSVFKSEPKTEPRLNLDSRAPEFQFQSRYIQIYTLYLSRNHRPNCYSLLVNKCVAY